MYNKYILAAISLFMVCAFAGCAESSDLTTQDAVSSTTSESEEVATAETDSQVETDSQAETNNESEETNYEAETITSEAAENIALDNLGITRSNVKYIHSYEEHDGGSIVAWCVEFEVGNTQYSYYVDMATGEILEMFEETHD